MKDRSFQTILRWFVIRRQSRIKLLFTVVCISLTFVLWYKIFLVLNNDVEPSAVIPEGNQVCIHPNLPINNSEIMQHIKTFPKIVCNTEEDWVINNGTHAYLSDFKTKSDSTGCEFTPLEFKNDSNTVEGTTTRGSVYEFANSDFVKVDCNSVTGKSWSSYLAAPRKNISIPLAILSNGVHPKLNVLIWGHDSISRNMFIRKLKKTYNLLKENIKSHILEGYNVVGDGTPAQLIPILTGYTEMELPEVRRSKLPDAKYLDQAYPFIWNEYKNKGGYLTAYIEDCHRIGTFQYRLMGFSKPPTDFYMRQFFVATEKEFPKYPNYCIGSIPRHKIIMNYVKNILLQNNPNIPKFIFSFHSELSHNDINLIEGADHDLVDFFKELQESGILNSTILIVMSDHGPRFAKHRENQQGKMEERMPFFSFAFPDWFEKVYKTPYKNFLTNKHRLATPFDIHQTLLDILDMNGNSYDDIKFQTKNHLKTRQMSLFKEIPISRSCEDADIEAHWCACLNWSPVNINSNAARSAANAVLSKINQFTSTFRNMCSELQLSKIIYSARYSPSEQLLKFKKSADKDGRVADLSDTTAATHIVYQVTIETVPGNAHYEASVSYNSNSNKYVAEVASISRTNKYGEQARCIDTGQVADDIRKFCYCLK